MDIEQLYRDYNVTYLTEGHKHCRPGWVQVPCPFCTGNPGYHLGYDTNLDRFVCWRCGGKHPIEAISRILNVPKREAYILLRQYGVLTGKTTEITRKPRTKSFKLPSGTSELQRAHIEYLEKRGFDAQHIIDTWSVQATGIYAKVGTLDYSRRIIIPFFWDGEIVSYDSRDITGRHPNKYQACELEREIIPHKDILYGRQEHWNADVGICCEGPTDVWRMGVRAFATSGIKFTAKQVRLMAKNFKRVVVLYDDDPQAVVQANKLIGELKFRGVDAFRVDIKGDPGSLTQEEANYLLKQII